MGSNMTNHQRTAAWLAACGKTPNVGNASLASMVRDGVIKSKETPNV